MVVGGVHPPVHSSGCFILPNPWDVGSAWALYRTGGERRLGERREGGMGIA